MKCINAYRTFAFACFLNFFFTGNILAETHNPSPMAFVQQTVYEFSPVIAGTEVTHSFSIVNQGDALLNIPGVYAG